MSIACTVRAAERAEVLHDTVVPDHGVSVEPTRAVADDLAGVVDRDGAGRELRFPAREDREQTIVVPVATNPRLPTMALSASYRPRFPRR